MTPMTVPDARRKLGPKVRGQGQRTSGVRAMKPAQVPQGDEVATVSPLYKTRLCNFFAQGCCKEGARCTFAHGEADLRESPDFERTSVCPTMLRDGVCDRPGCRYAHKKDELREDNRVLKTKFCSFFLDGGCVVGSACRFAHSIRELQEADALDARRKAAKVGQLVLREQRRALFAKGDPDSQGTPPVCPMAPPPPPMPQPVPVMFKPTPTMPFIAVGGHCAVPAGMVLTPVPPQFSDFPMPIPAPTTPQASTKDPASSPLAAAVTSDEAQGLSPPRAATAAELLQRDLSPPESEEPASDKSVALIEVSSLATAAPAVVAEEVTPAADIEEPLNHPDVQESVEGSSSPTHHEPPADVIVKVQDPQEKEQQGEQPDRNPKLERGRLGLERASGSESATAPPPSLRSRRAHSSNPRQSPKVKPARAPVVKLRAEVDIEDTAILPPCATCDKNPGQESYVVERRPCRGGAPPGGKKGTKAPVRIIPDGDDSMVGTVVVDTDCTRICPHADGPADASGSSEPYQCPTPFADCSLCSKATGCSVRPCAACNCGYKVVTQNTFLTLTEDIDEEVRPMRRSRSL
mmetsp:Transcript_21600/g.50409  ORF Transcript_21600/g.50409 Transcript_21600/m.50409 type:complete len:577 (-) Transcript_21600:306-2036(-)